MYVARFSWCLPISGLLSAPAGFAQSAGDGASPPTQVQNVSACEETPREDASPSLCAPPSSEEERHAVEPLPPATIPLTIPAGTPLRIALGQRARLNHVGEPVHGTLVQPG